MSRAVLGATCGLLLGIVAAVAAADGAPWRRAGEVDGVVVEERSVAGSSILEVRAWGRSPLPPDAVAATAWNHREYIEFVPHLKRLDILAEGPDWKVVYEQVAMPLVSDRDYTLRLRRVAFPESGRFEVRFAAAPDEGPPASDGHVRVRSIEGTWVIEPHPDGGTRATYTVRSDPGGAIPAWVVNRLQVGVTGGFVRAVLERAEARRGGPDRR